ncbi:MAG: polyhydroxyalkanoate synthesis repressor PhaR [Alphaproteobacteria bacterium]|nr:MAG: polyhydroxyalkanoate synthesis repressor PhaR [Alphaproteobacteria bacterium]
MAGTETSNGKPVVIKKYANRRLYNTETSSYVTLEHLAQMVKDGREFVVRDAKTGEDITRSVLTQIIFEEESKGGQTLLPVGFLRQLISFYGQGLEAVVPNYLETALELFNRNQERYCEYFQKQLSAANSLVPGKAFGPFEELARQNLAAFEQAARMFGGLHREEEDRKTGVDKKTSEDELDALRRQLKTMQDQLDALSRKSGGR